MKIKHFGLFQNAMNHLDWETLRNDETQKPYFLPFDKQDYLDKVDTDELTSTKIILQEINKSGHKKVFSIGSGIALQEFQLKKFSDYEIVVSDYSAFILRLKKFEIFDKVLILDAFADPWPIDESWFVIFPRIDTEFDDQQLSELFAKCYNAGITHICFIPGELISFRILISEVKTLIMSIIKRKKRIFCGYARTISCFTKIWGLYYHISAQYMTEKPVFFLQQNKK